MPIARANYPGRSGGPLLLEATDPRILLDLIG